MAKWCDECGYDLYVCQKCGKDFCPVSNPIADISGIGNVCPGCNHKIEIEKVTRKEYVEAD